MQLENIIQNQDARISDLVNTNQQLETRIRSLENDLQEEWNQTSQRLFGNFTFNFLENGNSSLVKNRKLNKYIYCFIIINFLKDRQPFYLQHLRQLFMLYFVKNLKK